MNELIAVNYETERPTVSGRELHEALEIETPYHKWFPRMCEYGFTENKDYSVTDIFVPNSNGGKQTQINHQLTIPMAKEICMLQRNDKGKQFRQYFIKVEEAWNSPEMVMKRALEIANRRVEELREKITADAPKVLFANAVEASQSSILIGDLAKILRQNGVRTGQKRLFELLRGEGYLMKRGKSYNMPTQKAMELGLFEVKERAIKSPDDSTLVVHTTMVTGHGQTYFINKFLSSQREGYIEAVNM